MRWFVETSSIGKTEPPEKACIEAAGWQQALQQVRARRGDAASIASFSVELLDEGYRAIDPGTRTRYVINRAPDDAPVVPSGADPAPAPSKAEAPAAQTPEPTRTRARVSIPDDPVPRAAEPPGRPATPPAPTRPGATARRSSMPTGGGPTRMLVAHRVASERAREPDAKSPLVYRELALVVAPATARDEVEALLRARFESVRRALGERKGRYVVIAVFDHEFHGSPNKLPVATLTWKDWRAPEPQVLFHDDESPPASIMANTELHGLRRPSAAPPAAAAPAGVAARTSAPATVPRAPDSIQRAAASMAGEDEPTIVKPEGHLVPSAMPSRPMAVDDVTDVNASPIAAEIPATVRSAPPAALPAGATPPATLEIPRPSSLPQVDRGPEVEVSFEAEADQDLIATPALHERVTAPSPHPAPAPAASAPLPARVAAVDASDPPPIPRGQRVKGDELLSDLFDSSGDLEFVQDALDGADFVLNLALEKLPCEVGIVSFFDMNRREFIIVRQRGGLKKALLSSLPEKAEVANRAMRSRHSIVLAAAEGAPHHPDIAGDNRWSAMGVTPRRALCAPVLLGGRYLGLIELANPLDDAPFTASDGHALDYLGQQLAEFLGSRTISVDPDAVNKPPLRARMR